METLIRNCRSIVLYSNFYRCFPARLRLSAVKWGKYGNCYTNPAEIHALAAVPYN